MRIISGRFRGLQLTVPKDAELRPSSDRLRSGVFSALDSLELIQGSEVLDLFAGTGSYGFEALSRGASHAVFVEQDRSMVLALQASSKQLGATEDATIVPGILPAALARVADVARTRQIPGYSLVFADPPYAFAAEWLPNLLAEYLVVHSDSVLVYESRKDSPPYEERIVPELGGMKFEMFKERLYGDSVVRFYRWR